MLSYSCNEVLCPKVVTVISLYNLLARSRYTALFICKKHGGNVSMPYVPKERGTMFVRASDVSFTNIQVQYSHALCSQSIKKKIFIYLAMPDLSCGTQALPSSFVAFVFFQLQHAGSSFVACDPLVVAYGIQFSNQGLNSGCLPWEHRVLATGPPGKSLDSLWKLSFRIIFLLSCVSVTRVQ